MKRLAAVVALLLAFALPAHAGAATLRLNMQGRIDSLDPALGFESTTWEVEYATCVKLVNYPDIGGPRGATPRLEAASFEFDSRDNLTRTFFVMPGRYFFSDGEPVTAASFMRAFTRSLDPALHSPAANYVHDIVGADAYAAGAASTIQGITQVGPFLSIHLTRAAPDLLQRLALPFFCAVPTWAPSTPDDSLPSAGPYDASSVDLNGLTTLERNPFYIGTRPRPWDEIDVRAFQDGLGTEAALIAGQADWAFDGLPIDRYAAFAAAHPGQLFVNSTPSVAYFVLRTNRPLMADPNMRRAFNLALDRNALAQTVGAFALTPTDQIVPPGIPGFRDVSIVPFAGDLIAAKALAAPHAGQTATVLSCRLPRCVNQAAIAQTTLEALGLKVVVWQAASRGDQIRIEQSSASPFDVTSDEWLLDYPDPVDVVNLLTHSGSPGNASVFSDPVFDAREDAAAVLSGAPRATAFASLDEDLMRQAVPIAPFANGNQRDAFSARIGCQTFNPAVGMDIVDLCLKEPAANGG
jgi:peptide/nickel transport system substrate-binding protein